MTLQQQNQTTYTYAPNGHLATETKASKTITINLRFPGQYYDQETGTHYNYFRDYNPNIGRYNESDPIGLFGGINPYGYVGANPFMYYDPYGLWSFGDIVDDFNEFITAPPIVNTIAGWGDGVLYTMSFGYIDTASFRKKYGIGNVDKCADEYSKAYIVGIFTPHVMGFANGGEITGSGWRVNIGHKGPKTWRIAPYGNRVRDMRSQVPHYHRPRIDQKIGKPAEGQGMGRHRPWESKSNDKSFWDRF